MESKLNFESGFSAGSRPDGACSIVHYVLTSITGERPVVRLPVIGGTFNTVPRKCKEKNVKIFKIPRVWHTSPMNVRRRMSVRSSRTRRIEGRIAQTFGIGIVLVIGMGIGEW
jgi:hypothetical protein